MESWREEADDRKPEASEGGPARRRPVRKDERDVLARGRGKE